MLKKIYIPLIIPATMLLSGCTKLDEKFQGDLSQGQVSSGNANTATLLQGVYNSLEFTFTSFLFLFPLSEISTDAAIAPIRGQDWYDLGVWRALHEHKWISNNERIKDCFNRLSGTVHAATDLLAYNPTAQQGAEARFIRAWVMYLLLDLFDQVPYREPGENLTKPARVRKGIEALDYIINELSDAEKNLPTSPAYRANKYAAKFLLMKCYLNKAVYENRHKPSFNNTDMNKVISLADEIINSSMYSFSKNYFDNFAPNNSNIGKENIFTQFSPSFSQDNVIWFSWSITTHYFLMPSGFNGWTTLSDFYDKFEPTDKRRGAVYSVPGASPPNPANAVNIGFLAGQQYDYETGAPLNDRTGAPLFFTREVKLIETGTNFEVTGIRPVKYFPDWKNYITPDNDLVYFRFPDVLLMKAEAILRGGTSTNAGSYGSTPGSLVNAVRTHPSRGASVLSPVNLDNLLDERGRELWWESWRRQDLIRFEKFLLPFQEKNYTSDPMYLIYPIPDEQVVVNPNLKQNPGY